VRCPLAERASKADALHGSSKPLHSRPSVLPVPRLQQTESPLLDPLQGQKPGLPQVAKVSDMRRVCVRACVCVALSCRQSCSGCCWAPFTLLHQACMQSSGVHVCDLIIQRPRNEPALMLVSTLLLIFYFDVIIPQLILSTAAILTTATIRPPKLNTATI